MEVSDEVRTFQRLHELPMFLPKEYLRSKVFPGIAIVIVLLVIVYRAWLFAVEIYSPEASKRAKLKASYQLTNFCVNTALGIMGWYHFNYTIPQNPTFEEHLVGLESLYPFSCLQLGFQLWSIPVGIFLVNESPAMLAHHVAVLWVGALSGFFTIGFRYWTPFMYGVLELSSVPLAIMNTFKDNPKWIQGYPAVYTMVRLAFAFSFLYIRWYLYLPQKFLFLRIAYQGLQVYQSLPSPSPWYVFFTWSYMISSFLLAVLQLYWGYLILRGLLSVFIPKKKRDKAIKSD